MSKKEEIRRKAFEILASVLNSERAILVNIGQYSEVKRTANFPPFDEWWDRSKDILDYYTD